MLGKQRYESKYMAIKYFYEDKGWSINWMCKQLSVSRAAYYKWLHREIPIQEQENIELASLIKEYDERFNHILGYRRMTSWINHFNHTNYSKKRVHRIMKKLNILSFSESVLVICILTESSGNAFSMFSLHSITSIPLPM